MTVSNFKLKTFLKTFTYYEDGDPPPSSPPTVPPAPPPPPPKTFTQADVDRMMAEHRKGLQTQNQQLITQLEELRGNANLTIQQKDELEARIGVLSQQHLTKEQQTAAEVEKWKKKYETDTQALTAAEKAWKNRFESQIITTSLLAAADKHKAASARQLVLMLKSQVKVVEALGEDGKPTGEFVTKMPVQKIDPKTKQPISVEIDIDEAIAAMREDPEYGNLFLIDGKPGFGGNNVGNNAGNGKAIDWSKISPEEYRKLRKEGKV